MWLARRAGSVLSLEDNEHWLARARELLVAAAIENAEVRHLPVEHLAAEIEAMPDESFDLVVIDFLESPEADRVEAVRAARKAEREAKVAEAAAAARAARASSAELLARNFASMRQRAR